MSKTTLVVCRDSGDWDIFDTDEYGWHNPAGLQSSASSIAAVILGDSFAEGECAASDKDVGSFLRASGVRAVNLAHGGDGPILELATLREYAAPLHPKAVFWLYFERNDLKDLRREIATPEFARYLDDPDYIQGLRASQPAIDSLLRSVVDRGLEMEKDRNLPSDRLWGFFTIEHIRGVSLRAMKRLSGQTQREERRQYDAEERLIDGTFLSTLRQAKTEVSSWGGTLFFVYLPSTLRYTTRVSEQSFHRERVLAVVRQLGIPIIDFHAALETHRDAFARLFPYYPSAIDSHYTAEGYQLLAETLLARIKK